LRMRFRICGWVSENHEMKRPVVGVIGNTYLAEARFASQSPSQHFVKDYKAFGA
jgi:hypothetical protein